LIDADLIWAESAARTCVEKKVWWPRGRMLTSEGWQQHRDVIASILPLRDWTTVLVAVEAVDNLQDSRNSALTLERARLATDRRTRRTYATSERRGLDMTEFAPALTDVEVKGIKPMLADIQAGRAALDKLKAF
jgi:hypothetical protein